MTAAGVYDAAFAGVCAISMLNGMVAEDFDGDGNLDLVIMGMIMVPTSLRVVMMLERAFSEGDGKGGFVPETILQSGIYIPGDGKSLVALRGAGGHYLLAAGQNRGDLKIFETRGAVAADTVAAYGPGRGGDLERWAGAPGRVSFRESFLSQSGRSLLWNPSILSVSIIGQDGKKRMIK